MSCVAGCCRGLLWPPAGSPGVHHCQGAAQRTENRQSTQRPQQRSAAATQHRRSIDGWIGLRMEAMERRERRLSTQQQRMQQQQQPTTRTPCRCPPSTSRPSAAALATAATIRSSCAAQFDDERACAARQQRRRDTHDGRRISQPRHRCSALAASPLDFDSAIVWPGRRLAWIVASLLLAAPSLLHADLDCAGRSHWLCCARSACVGPRPH